MLGVGGHGLALAAWSGALLGGSCLCFAIFQPAFASALVGIALGVAGHSFVGGVASGVEWVLTSRLGALNGHVLVTKYGLDFVEYEGVSDMLADDPEVLGTSPFAYGVATMSPPLREVMTDAAGEASPSVMMLKGVLPARVASFPGFEDMFERGEAARSLRPANPTTPPGLVLGQVLAERMGVDVGDDVVLAAPRPLDGTGRARQRPPRHASFEVTGIVTTGMREIDSRVGICHLTAAQALLFGEGRVTGVEAYVADARGAPAVAERVLARIQPEGKSRLYRATTWLAQGSELLQIVRRTQVAVHAALSLLLVVAAANLVGALIILMRRRAAQIATLGMLGASPRTQGQVFAAVGLSMGVIGGIFGVALACLAGALLGHTSMGLDASVYGVETLRMRPSVVDLVLPWAAAVLVCTAGTGPVAWAAGRLPPLAAVRRS